MSKQSEAVSRKRQMVPIVLDKQRNLYYNFTAWEEIENKFGSIEDALVALQGKKRMGIISYFIWVGLIHEDPELTQKDVSDWLDMDNLEEVMEVINRAFGKDMPDKKEAEKEAKNA
jgi:hypothetical protein